MRHATWKARALRRVLAILRAPMVAAIASGCVSQPPIPEDELVVRLEEQNRVLTPAGQGPFPAVLLLHTCYGNLGHVDEWGERLRRRGYVAVVVNSMKARGLDGHFDRVAVCGGRALRADDRARDIRISIRQLLAHPGVDPERIGIVGFSHGGWTVLDYIGRPSGRDPLGAGGQGGLGGLESVVLVYPFCGSEAMEGLAAWPGDLRVLMLLAGSDTTVGTRTCRRLAEAQSARGLAIRMHVYPGAKHGYDIDPALLYGYDARYDPSAAADTRKRIVQFLDETLMPERRGKAEDRQSFRHAKSAHSRLR